MKEDHMLFRAATVAIVAIVSTVALAQSGQTAYPTRPITVIVPTGAGSAPDVLVRKTGQELFSTLRQPFVVENRAGAAGMLGANAVARAAPDGYTLLMAWDGMMAINPVLYPKLSYNPQKDFVPVAATGRTEFVLVAHSSFEPNTLQELITFAKANPGKINYGSAGVGEVHHIAMEAIAYQAGIHLVHVPYAGGPAELNDIVAGHVPIGIIGLTPALPFLQTGKLKALAVLGKDRLRALPSVATVSETLPGYSIQGSWLGIFAPTGTPAAIVEELNADINRTLKDQAFSNFLLVQGIEPMNLTTAEFRQLIIDDTARFGEIIKKTGIHIE
jgi:tripartite-type tricarboxylate transporter receptor subunit TctC